ncbi:MAG: hypothetical protein Q6365_019515 [Candidatus Sigynarchaeota archaeon]
MFIPEAPRVGNPREYLARVVDLVVAEAGDVEPAGRPVRPLAPLDEGTLDELADDARRVRPRIDTSQRSLAWRQRQGPRLAVATLDLERQGLLRTGDAVLPPHARNEGTKGTFLLAAEIDVNGGLHGISLQPGLAPGGQLLRAHDVHPVLRAQLEHAGLDVARGEVELGRVDEHLHVDLHLKRKKQQPSRKKGKRREIGIQHIAKWRWRRSDAPLR